MHGKRLSLPEQFAVLNASGIRLHNFLICAPQGRGAGRGAVVA